MDYSLRELQCFTAVAEELSFTRAAKKLRLAQPPLSRHVRALEEKLGLRLLERSDRKVALTTAGEFFYHETRGVLPQLVRAGEAARRFATGETVRLRLGFVSAVLSPELVEVLQRFRERHPSVQLMVQDGSPADLLQALRRGELDGAFVGLEPPERTPGIHFTPWRTEALAVFVPSGHRLSAQREVSLRELASEAMVAVSREAAPAFTAFVREACLQAGFRPRIILESARAQAVAVMVAAGAGIALLPASLARILGEAATILSLKKSPRITHVFARPAGPPPAGVREFLSVLGEGGQAKR